MTRTPNGLRLVLFASLPVLIAASGALTTRAPSQYGKTGAAVAVAVQFHRYLASGDSANAVRLLAPDVVVLESGDRETRAEYIANHLRADIEFATAIATTRTVTDARRQGDVVWIVATTASKGRFHDRQVDSIGAELILLSRSGDRWVIRAIHWSSHRAAGQ